MFNVLNAIRQAACSLDRAVLSLARELAFRDGFSRACHRARCFRRGRYHTDLAGLAEEAASSNTPERQTGAQQFCDGCAASSRNAPASRVRHGGGTPIPPPIERPSISSTRSKSSPSFRWHPASTTKWFDQAIVRCHDSSSTTVSAWITATKGRTTHPSRDVCVVHDAAGRSPANSDSRRRDAPTCCRGVAA